jgi:hypothetical protein
MSSAFPDEDEGTDYTEINQGAYITSMELQEETDTGEGVS